MKVKKYVYEFNDLIPCDKYEYDNLEREVIYGEKKVEK